MITDGTGIQFDILAAKIKEDEEDSFYDLYRCVVCDGTGEIYPTCPTCPACGESAGSCPDCADDDPELEDCEDCYNGSIEIMSNWAYSLDLVDPGEDKYKLAQDNGYTLFVVDADHYFIVRHGIGYSDNAKRLWLIWKLQDGWIGKTHLRDRYIDSVINELTGNYPALPEAEIDPFIAYLSEAYTVYGKIAKGEVKTIQRGQAERIVKAQKLESPTFYAGYNDKLVWRVGYTPTEAEELGAAIAIMEYKRTLS